MKSGDSQRQGSQKTSIKKYGEAKSVRHRREEKYLVIANKNPCPHITNDFIIYYISLLFL